MVTPCKWFFDSSFSDEMIKIDAEPSETWGTLMDCVRRLHDNAYRMCAIGFVENDVYFFFGTFLSFIKSHDITQNTQTHTHSRPSNDAMSLLVPSHNSHVVSNVSTFVHSAKHERQQERRQMAKKRSEINEQYALLLQRAVSARWNTNETMLQHLCTQHTIHHISNSLALMLLVYDRERERGDQRNRTSIAPIFSMRRD